MATSTGERLVIFGCGYVGGALARQAIARGLRVTALTRNPATAEALREAGVEVIAADLAASEWHGRIAGGAKWVVNTVSGGGAGIEGYRSSYLAGMKSIIAWAEKTGPVGTLVYTSSTSVYPQDGGVVVDEQAETGGTERAEILVAAEREMMVGRSRGACGRYFILRLAGIYGPGRHYLLEQVRSGKVAGVDTHRLNLVHRDDVVAALWAALDAPATVADEVFNVADDYPAPKGEVVAWIAARLGVATPVFTGLPAGARRALTPDRVIANGKLQATLGWRPRFPDFRSGYENVLAAGAV